MVAVIGVAEQRGEEMEGRQEKTGRKKIWIQNVTAVNRYICRLYRGPSPSSSYPPNQRHPLARHRRRPRLDLPGPPSHSPPRAVVVAPHRRPTSPPPARSSVAPRHPPRVVTRHRPPSVLPPAPSTTVGVVGPTPQPATPPRSAPSQPRPFSTTAAALLQRRRGSPPAPPWTSSAAVVPVINTNRHL
uniref:Uncharacterized protein n=1 Tax=Oryza nivara TaxID=4536 RepID=A0A0E0HZ18_ORYNI